MTSSTSVKIADKDAAEGSRATQKHYRRSGTATIAFLVMLIIIISTPVVSQAEWLKKRLSVQKLDNGLTILVYPRHNSPTFSGYITVDVGSSDEHLGITGIAHMFEHMAFKGTHTIGTTDYKAEKPLMSKIDQVQSSITEELNAKTPDKERLAALRKQYEELIKQQEKFIKKDEFSETYDRNGAQGLNASTSYDFTNYFLSLPVNRLELWMWMESDRLLNPVMREFYTERDVILEERNMRVENSPGGKLWETFLAQAFIAHPYGYPILGWPDDMKRLTRPMAENFRKELYIPKNMIVVLVGDLDPQQVLAMADKYFGRLPAGTNNREVPAREPEQIGERRFSIQRDAKPSLMIGYHKPTVPDRADMVAEVTSMILSEGRTSRLYRSLAIEKQIVTGIDTFTAPADKYPNLFMISATPRAPHTTDEVEQAVYEGIDKLGLEGPTDKELQKVKNQLDADLQRSLRSNDGLAGLLAYYTALTRDPDYLEKYIEGLKTVTSDEIKTFVKSTLVAANRTVGWITPAPKAVEAPTTSTQNATAPSPAAQK